MSWWQRTFGRKAAYMMPPDGDVTSVVLGYPNWPIFDSYGSMYRRQPAVRTVVDFFSTNIAQLHPKIYERVDDTDRREWNDHPLAVRLRNPNPTTTRFAHLRDTVADLKIYDRAYWRKIRSRGLIAAFVRLPPSRLLVEVDQKTLKTTYKFDGEVLSRDELVIFHGYHPDGGEQGVPPLETLRRVLSEEWAATTHREWYWRNAARQSGIIERSMDAPEWTNSDRLRFREQWESSMVGGVNSGRTAILEDSMTWKPSAFSPKDSEYIEGRKLTYTEVARVYGPALVSLVSDGGGVTATEANHRHIYQDALAPTLRMLQDEIDGQLLTLDEFDLGSPTYCEFNLADKLKGSFEEQSRVLTTNVGVPIQSVNEGRVRLNYPRIEEAWADVPVRPLNVLYGGQPAVTVPTSDPGLSSPSWGGAAMLAGVSTPRELAEMIQKIYLGVGVVLSADEAREILNRAGASLEVSGPAVMTAAQEFAAKLRSFFDRQEQVVCSKLLALPNQGETSVFVAWGKESRWIGELADVYQHQPDAFQKATEINRRLRHLVAAAFVEGGLPAVHAVFEDVKPAAQLQPALSA